MQSETEHFEVPVGDEPSVLTIVASDDGATGEPSPEARAMVDHLKELRDAAEGVIARALVDRFDDESLAREPLHWEDVAVARAEFWIADTGEQGYKVDVEGKIPGMKPLRFGTYLRDRLQDRGWDNVVVEFVH